jgi:hypothetical protein
MGSISTKAMRAGVVVRSVVGWRAKVPSTNLLGLKILLWVQVCIEVWDTYKCIRLVAKTIVDVEKGAIKTI